VVLGNIGTREDLAALQKTIEEADPMLQEHATWATRQILARI
jgi:epoxyqueuosine reductase